MKEAKRAWRFYLALILLLALLAPVSDSLARRDADEGTYFYLDLSDKGNFFDVPFPSDIRRMPDGSIDMSRFPNSMHSKMFTRYIEGVAHGYGFSTGTTVYFHATGPVNSANLPASPAASLKPESPVFLVDIDPQSPERGRILPVLTHFYAKRPDLNFGPKNLLAVMALPGFALRENTTYAVVINKSLGDREGNPLSCSPYFEDLKRGMSPDGRLGGKARDVYAPLWDWLKEAGLDAGEIAAATVFTTGDPTAEMLKIFEYVDRMDPLTLDPGFRRTREYDDYYVIEGTFTAPQFQTGTPPYGHGKGGRIKFDNEGMPIVQRHEDVPVAISIPKGRMPASGFPLLVYIHGTAGVSTQVIDRGYTAHHASTLKAGLGKPEKKSLPIAGEGPAFIVARRGIAAVGAAQPQNGERGGHPSMIPYYNFLSPEALRDNIRQSVAEAFMLVRLMQNLELDPSLCPGTDTSVSTRGKIFFDPDLFFTMGQSLGSLILNVFAPVETDIIAAIPSGAGAHWSVFVADCNPTNSKSMKRKGVGIGEILGLEMFNPMTSLMNTVLAPCDPLSYAPHMIQRPFPGREPKNVWMPIGLYDHYFSPISQNAVITSLGLDMAGEILEESLDEWMDVSGAEILEFPVSGNIPVESGKAVTGMSQHYYEDGVMDGHDINFQLDETKYQYGCFLYSIVNQGKAVIYEPRSDVDAPCGQ